MRTNQVRLVASFVLIAVSIPSFFEVPVAIASKALGAEDFDTMYNECVLQIR
jgi:hypothetical protein